MNSVVINDINQKDCEFKLDNIHLVLITSVLKPKIEKNVYTEEQRFSQLLETIMSVKKKIPNYYIVIIEGTPYSEYQKKIILKMGCNIFYVNVDNFNKQFGEVFLLRTFVLSDFFENLKKNIKILSINKISGRYTLNKNFVFYYDDETCVCKIINPSDSYSKKGLILTRYYSIPFKYLNNYVEGLTKCLKQIFINIEHSFYLYNVIPIDKINKNITKINVCGNLAPNGEYVED